MFWNITKKLFVLTIEEPYNINDNATIIREFVYMPMIICPTEIEVGKRYCCTGYSFRTETIWGVENVINIRQTLALLIFCQNEQQPANYTEIFREPQLLAPDIEDVVFFKYSLVKQNKFWYVGENLLKCESCLMPYIINNLKRDFLLKDFYKWRWRKIYENIRDYYQYRL